MFLKLLVNNSCFFIALLTILFYFFSIHFVFYTPYFLSHLSVSAVTEALIAPAQYPGCSGTRNLHDNLSDLRAQVAANQRGSQLVRELIDSYGLAVVQAYMGYIQVNCCYKQKFKKEKFDFFAPQKVDDFKSQ